MPVQEFFGKRSSLLVLGGLTVFAPLIDGGTTHLPVFIIRLTLLCALTVWALVSMRSGLVVVPSGRLVIVTTLFIGWAALSVFRSPYTAISLQWLVSILSYAMLLFLVLQLVRSIGQVWMLVMVVLGMGCVEALVGINQFLWRAESRPTGTFFNPNFFATYEVAVFSILFGLLCFGRREQIRRWQWWLLICISGVVAGAFVLAQSRGAVAALVVALAYIGVSRFGKVFWAVLMLCLIVGVVVPNPLKQRALSVAANDTYAFTRFDIWKNSLQRIGDHPWGVGLGMFKYSSFQYRFPVETAVAQYGKRAESAHNEYLQITAELGVAGLALFLATVGLWGAEVKALRNAPLEPWETGLVTGLTGGVLGILTHGLVDSVFHEPALVLLGLLLGGLLLVMKRVKGIRGISWQTVSLPYRPSRAILVGVCAGLFLLLIIRPAAAWYAFEQGAGEWRNGREDLVLAWYQRAVRIDPGNTMYRDAMAKAEIQLFRQSGDPEWLLRAAQELETGFRLNALDGRFPHWLGGVYVLLASRSPAGAQRETRLEQAAGYYERAVQVDPYTPFNYLELGKLRQAQGKMDEAQVWFQNATNVEPNFLPARVHLAELFLRMGRLDGALAEYALIRTIHDRYRGRPLTSLEQQYLDVDLEPLKRALAVAGAA